MKIYKKTESVYEIIFDETEVKCFEDIEDIFEVTPEEVMDRTISESLRLGMNGIHNLINIVTEKENENDGHKDSETSDS